MEYLLYSRSSLSQVSTFVSYTAESLPLLSKLVLLLYALAGLAFLIEGIRTRGRRLDVVGGLLLLLYAGLTLYWDLDIGFIQSRSATWSFYFGWKFVGGASVVALLAMVEPRSTRVVPRVSCTLLLAFNLLALVLLNVRHFRLGTRLYSAINGFLVGATVVSVIFYWLDQRGLLMKIVPADDTIARMEEKASEWEDQAKGESAPTANRFQKMAKLSREWAAALKTRARAGKWTS